MVEKPVEKAEKTSAIPRSPDLMSAEDSALLVVDAQVKLLEIIPQRARIVWNIRRLLDAADALRVPIRCYGAISGSAEPDGAGAARADRLRAEQDVFQRVCVRRNFRGVASGQSLSRVVVWH